MTPTNPPVTTEYVSLGKTVHWAASTPPAISLRGFSISQKGRSFYFMRTTALDLDMLCRVPVLPYDVDNSTIASWVMSSASDRWQRELDEERIKEIAIFFSATNNFLANSAVISLSLRQEQIQTVNGFVEFKILPSWMVTRCPKCAFAPASTADPHYGQKFDSCPKCEWEGRPGLIIDGQHRIRGGAVSKNSQEEVLTTVLTENVFSKPDMAKIFTEITTSAVDLHHLHKTYLLYKFGLRSLNIGTLSDADFRTTPPAPPAVNTLGLRNRRAYEIAAELCSLTNSHWNDRVSMLPHPHGRARRTDVIDVDRLVSYVEKWLESGVFKQASQPDGMMTVSDAVMWLQDYLESILSTWPGPYTPPGVWHPNRNMVGVLQQRGIFEVLVWMFPIITSRILALSAPVNRTAYSQQWAYVEKHDWTDPAWSELGDPDKNKEMLFRILEHFFVTAPNPVGPVRIPSAVNSWIKGAPDACRFISTPSSTQPVSVATKKKPLEFKWESVCAITSRAVPKPVNAYSNATIFVSQYQGGQARTLLEETTQDNSYKIEAVPIHLDTSTHAGNVTIEVRYANGVQFTSLIHSHPAV
jgi:hypothetical protein